MGVRPMAWSEISSRMRSSLGMMRTLRSLSRMPNVREEIGEMALDGFADFIDALVDVLHLGHLDDLIDGLLDGGAGVVGDLASRRSCCR